MKAHVLRYANEGKNVITATDLEEAIISHGGVRGVRVAVLSNIEQQVTKTGQGKLDGTRASRCAHPYCASQT